MKFQCLLASHIIHRLLETIDKCTIGVGESQLLELLTFVNVNSFSLPSFIIESMVQGEAEEESLKGEMLVFVG